MIKLLTLASSLYLKREENREGGVVYTAAIHVYYNIYVHSEDKTLLGSTM